MSELHDRYDRAAVSDRIIPPPFAELAERGRRRAYRNRAVGLAGVAVLAALVAAPVLALPGEKRLATPAASPLPSPAAEADWWYGTAVSFLDVNHGVVVYDLHKRGEAGCTEWLSVTHDGGTTWSELRELPSYPDEERIEDESFCVTPQVIPIAADTLVIPASSIHIDFVSAGLEPPGNSYISHDAGHTWQEYEPAVRTVETIPDGVVPGLYCEAQVLPSEDDPADVSVEWCERDRVGWYDPQTGDQMVLRNNPPSAKSDVTLAADGSIWASGLDAGGAYRVSVSRDRGHSWLDRAAAAVDNIDAATAAVLRTIDGDTAYFYWTLEAAEPAPIHLYRTTDGGESWQSLAAGQLFEGVINMWATRDGDLVVVDWAEDMYVSHDGGETFDNLELPVSWDVQPITGGFLATGFHDYSAGERVDGAVSEDGLTWREFQLPVPTP